MSYTTTELRDYLRCDVDEMLDWAADEIDRLKWQRDELAASLSDETGKSMEHVISAVEKEWKARTP